MEETQFLDDDFDADIDLTPLIDVVFMLLLFFILAASFSQPVLQVALPAAGTADSHAGARTSRRAAASYW